MTSKKKIVTITDMKPGMKLAEEIRINNTLILPSGVIITETILNKLGKNYFHNLFTVYDRETTDSVDNLSEISDGDTIKEIENNFTMISQDLEKVFTNINGIVKIDINEIREFANMINSSLKSPNAVIKNIVLHGSGDDTIFKHSVNVTALSAMLGKCLGFNAKDINLLTYSALLHDFGKTKIPKHILNKAGILTEDEKKAIQLHSIISYNLVKDIPYLDKSVCSGILMHHERMDGSGYPLGVKGEKIHSFAKIIAIADVFDAVNSNRIHKKRKDPFRALNTIQKNSLLKLDYEYCKVFIDHIVNYYVGEKVLLNNGKVCRIIQIDKNNLSKPFIMDENDFIDLSSQKNLHIENLVV
jgi:HD-GYP domain-containing protein (c-di-GMP phosphodiesterase class II)